MAKNSGAATQYSYGTGFQRDALTLSVREPTFLVEVRDAMSPDYFEDEVGAITAKLILHHWDRYRERIPKDRLVHKIQRHSAKYELDADFHKALISYARRLYSRDIPPDPQAMRETVAEFGRLQATKLALLECVDNLEDVESLRFDTIIPKLQSALAVGAGHNVGIPVFEDPTHPEKYRDENDDPKLRIKTGFHKLDRLTRGGAGPGKLYVVLAPSNVGKSMFLLNVACHAAKVGRRVIYVTTEMPEYDILVRVLSRMTGKTQREVETTTPSFREAAAKLTETGLDRYMRIVRVPPYHRVTDVRNAISRIEATDGGPPDLIVVDYADDLRPPSGSYSSRKSEDSDGGYLAFGAVYSELIQLGIDYEVPVWTATQANRSAYPKKGEESSMPGLETVSDSMKKVQLAHLIVSLSQTDEQAKAGKMSLYVPKHRGGQARLTFSLKVDFARCYMRDRGTDRARRTEPDAGEED